MLRLMLAAALAITIAGPVVSAADWTGWRGPARDGWVSGFQPPAEWPSELKQVWQTEVGTGYGSPLVAGDRVFQHARQGEDEVVYCLDLKTGEEKWRQSYAAPFKIGGGGEYHGKGPKSTPALADGRLFTMSISGTFSAWDTQTGKLLWRTDLSSRFEKTHPYWGTSSSPLVEGDRVIVHFGGDELGALIGLDAASGKVVWSQGEAGASYASPIVAEIQGVRQVIDLHMDGLTSVEPQSGRLLWEYHYPQLGTDQNMVTPVAYDGLVLLGGENRGIRGLKPELDGGKWTVRELWSQKDVALDMSSAVMNDGLLFGFSHYDSGRIFCLEPKSGEVLWQGPGRTGENVMFLAVPKYVIALIDNGQLRILSAQGEKYEPVATYRVGDSTWAPPVLMNSGLLIKDHDTLTLWSLAEGGE